ncbi:hypothetical protein D8674_039090 [Pyrus ussuriensis x Pyrus communis]|uniref:Uncharacterized protein n=1 Tax=Pyrus ussuriensis x Pyrus communis TaxID=2448454 RepID=A0A5N5GMD7_9ROSA|nr:hypothetical protein D8674_023066 [Pyrus ussuriensis x Pyrus communis]KAB2634311.1 hypothetical protein D8674_039090 [Pyrus ussuriensis x Pyrus communis]
MASMASTTPNLGHRRFLLLRARRRPPSTIPNLGRTKDEGGSPPTATQKKTERGGTRGFSKQKWGLDVSLVSFF